MNIFVFTDKDLDGAGCVLVTTWMNPKARIKFVSTNELNFREAFTKWWASSEAEDYDKVLICDLHIAETHSDILDHSKITIIDHHSSKEKILPLYKRAKLVVSKTATSSTKLWYAANLAVTPSNKLYPQNEKLINLIDDYDSYTLKYPESLDLNTIFFNLQGDKVKLFVDKYINGFSEFNTNEQNIIRFHKLKVQQTLNELKIFKADIPLDKVTRHVCSAFADYSVNDVAHHMIKNYGAEIAIVINLKNKTVSFRRSKESTYDLSKLAKQLANGSGHEIAAGGVITEQLLTFSKLFTPV